MHGARNIEVTMPSTSAKQARTMAAAAHDPAFAKKVGIPTSVAKEFNAADKGTHIRHMKPYQSGSRKPTRGK
jgi:hypothetical protein